jgi:hypothetical protein
MLSYWNINDCHQVLINRFFQIYGFEWLINKWIFTKLNIILSLVYFIMSFPSFSMVKWSHTTHANLNMQILMFQNSTQKYQNQYNLYVFECSKYQVTNVQVKAQFNCRNKNVKFLCRNKKSSVFKSFSIFFYLSFQSILILVSTS